MRSEWRVREWPLGDLLTRAGFRLKLKRPQTAKKFRPELDQLYAEALTEEKLGKGKAKARL